MTAFVLRLDDGRKDAALRVAVKDNIDLAGTQTTAGTRALDDRGPAQRDAGCLQEIRRCADAGTVHVVGKTNMHELAYGTTGRNDWFGTPVNPRHPSLIPGGSSSGSAVAVAAGEAEVALGTDTGGSVRIPATCCGVSGLKTTWGRIRLDGVWPLAPSLDTVGPIAADVAGLVVGMQLLELGFAPYDGDVSATKIHRLRIAGPCDPAVDTAVDRALARSGLTVTGVPDPGWQAAFDAADVLLSAEAWRADADLLRRVPERISQQVRTRIAQGESVDIETERVARKRQTVWRETLNDLVGSADVLALPVLPTSPPAVDAVAGYQGSWFNLPVNFAGLPALALPVSLPDGLPAGLQLVGPPRGEELLCALGQLVENATP